MFSCEFCEFSKDTFFIEQLWTAASTYGFLMISGGIEVD